MTANLSKVARGEIISADFFNTLIDTINNSQQSGPVQAVNADVIAVLMDTWAAYRGLIKKQLFLPVETTDEGIKARLAVSFSVRDIMDMALLNAIGASTIRMDSTGILAGFSDLYSVQDDLTTLLLTTMDALSGSVDRKNFGNILNTFLVLSGQNGSLSLQGTIASKNIPAIIAAQQRINNAVLNWSADSIQGSIQVVYKNSSRGRTLVDQTNNSKPNDPFMYTFTIYNKTDKNLDINLLAQFGSPHVDWKPAGIFDAHNNPLTSVSLKANYPFNPNKADSMTDVNVWVYTPNGSADNDAAPLKLTANIPQYSSQMNRFDQVQLTVGNVETPDSPEWLTFTDIKGDLADNKPVNEQVLKSLNLLVRYHNDNSPKSKNFIVKVALSTTADPSLFGMYFVVPQPDEANSTSTLLVSKPFQMMSDTESGSPVNYPLQIQAGGMPGSALKSADVTITVQVQNDSSVVTAPLKYTVSIKS